MEADHSCCLSAGEGVYDGNCYAKNIVRSRRCDLATNTGNNAKTAHRRGNRRVRRGHMPRICPRCCVDVLWLSCQWLLLRRLRWRPRWWRGNSGSGCRDWGKSRGRSPSRDRLLLLWLWLWRLQRRRARRCRGKIRWSHDRCRCWSRNRLLLWWSPGRWCGIRRQSGKRSRSRSRSHDRCP